MMKKMIKTGISIAVAVGMLAMSIPTVAFAEEVADTTVIDPNELLSEDELPEGAVVRDDVDDGDIAVYRYDEDGNLVQVEPVFEDDAPVNDNPVINKDPVGYEIPDMNEILDFIELLEINEIITEIGKLGIQPEKSIYDELESFGPLTPDGNLSLIDDYGAETKAGKQFITVQTKGGQYFYIIIDRDDSGNESVHFLNQVDESDILKYLEEDEVKAYEERKAAFEEKRAALAAEESALDNGSLTPAPVTKEKPVEEEPEAKLPIKVNSNSLMIVGIIVIVGIGAFVYMKIIKKKSKAVPDKNYEQDPDDWDDDKVDSELADVPDETEETRDE